jgi:hypothetical protein
VFKHLHIVACSPRSGTTLLHEVMATCFDIDRYYGHELRFNRAWAKPSELLLTKRPKDTLYVGELLRLDPDFYVIYLLRDPRDVIVSRHDKDKAIYYSNIRLWRELHDAARPHFSHPRFLRLRYEDFVAAPDHTQKQIEAAFSFLRRRHDFSGYHLHASVSAKSQLAMRGVRPISAASVGVWRQNLPRIRAQQSLHGSLTPLLIECGYERDDAWERLLHDVQPDWTHSRYPEKLPAWRSLLSRLDGWRKVRWYLLKRRLLAR